MFLFRSLRAKTVLWALIPLAIILVVVAVLARFAYEDAARDVVQQRDTELARISAARLSERLSNHSSALQSVAAEDALRAMDLARLAPALEDAVPRLNVFDAGVFVLDAQGSIVWPAVSNYSPALLAQGQLETVRRTLRPAVSDVYRLEQSGDDLITILVPIVNRENQFGGALAGVSNIRTSLLGATFAEVLELKAGQSGFAYLVDSNGRVIYHRDNSQLGRDLTAVVPVARSLGGNTGAVVSQDVSGQEVISGYAPVPGTGWALVTQEKWSKVIGPIESRSLWLLLLLAAGGLLSGALIFVAIGRTLGPIKQLTRSAQRIAEGGFDETITASSGDEVQTLAEQFNIMAGALKESYADLEQRVEARTEELRESNETLQALIQQSPVAILGFDREYNLRLWNPGAEQMFGWSAEEALGRVIPPFVTKGQEQEYLENMRRPMGGEATFGLEVRRYRKDGSPIDMSVWTAPLRDSKGDISGVVTIIVDVTEHNIAQEAIRESEERYRTLFEDSRDAIFIRSPEGKFIEVNQAALELFGFDREEAIGSDVADCYVDRADQGKFEQELERSGSVRDFEERLRKRDGSEMDCLTTSNLIRSADGAVIGYQGIVRDVTQSKRAEQALREAEEKYRDIFDNAVEGIFQNTPDGVYLAANPALARIYGYDSPDDLMATTTGPRSQLFAEPGQYDEVRKILEEHGAVFGFQTRIRRRDGRIIWVSISARAVRDDDGGIRYFEGIVEDITERVEAEEAEREADEKYRSIFDESRDAIFISSLEGEFIDVNQATLDLFGFTREEIIGSAVGERYSEPLDQARFRRALADAGSVNNFEERLVRKDGSVIDCEVSAVLRPGDDGAVPQVQGIIRDVTQRKKSEQELRDLQETERESAEVTARLAEIGRIVTSNLDIDEVYGRFAEEVKKLVDFDRISVNIIDHESGTFVFRYVSGVIQRGMNPGDVLPLDGTPTGDVVKTGKPLVRQGVAADVRFLGDQTLSDIGFRSSIHVPLKYQDRIIGVLSLRSWRKGVFGPREQSIVEHLADLIAPAVENAGLYSESQRAQEALRQAEQKYRRIFDDSKDPIIITSREGRILDANQAALDVFGYQTQDLIGLIGPEMSEDPKDHARLVAKINDEGSVKDYEIRLLRKDGSVADCLVSITVQRDDQDRIVSYQGMVRDITESKLAEEAAHQQTREVAVLEERNRMAREIHDTMAQGFTGIVLQMEAAEQSMEKSPGALGEHLNRARALAREGLQEARRSIWGLMPHALEQSTLDAALKEEVRRFDAEGQEKIAFNQSGKRRELPTDVQTVLFRICQESLTNIRRHAQASEVNVNLKYHAHEVLLSVQDNGVGFDPATVRNEKSGVSFGLIGMQQRAEQIEGKLVVDSTESKGTLVQLTIPTP